MSGGVYGGDEVGALVFDIGSCTSRVGYAGEDCPKADIPTVIGVGPGEDTPMDTEDSEAPIKPAPSNKYYIDTTVIGRPREGVEMKTPLKDGIIKDWELYQQLINHLYTKHIKTDSDLHPVLMTEPTWNTKSDREKLTELMFETYKVPAFFLSKTAVLSAFANGRSTALVIDSGANQTSAVPVHDGYALSSATTRTPLAGDFITAQCRGFLDEQKIEVVPHYLVASKEPVKERAPANYVKKKVPEVTTSFHEYMVKKVISDFQASICQVSTSSLRDEIETSTSIPTTLYEFPNGYNINLTVEKFKLTEGLFDSSTGHVKGISGGNLLSIPNVALHSASVCDSEIKPALYGSVVVVGGNSLLNGFTERLNRDLTTKTPQSVRIKMVQNVSTVERKFSSWIGGSILASLGTFQQMWISKQEYEETGKSVVQKKCP
ncbi:PREDICTED: actin-like protein 6A [Amphimedon queenslandica]|uniref:Actin, cytoplasmic n=1 Tax=Amphimedon queenslandica TaxID=400682 RepID=A0A1X7V093_AMPQE|nr:PREDICTED: actin-like protein 6A [Amphimedon queenslandica]|eukprot:XP_003386197.1 PREDICTED: actin-like protein 6A [Amphimedon queenslandica]